jgi:hypothetical protein
MSNLVDYEVDANKPTITVKLNSVYKPTARSEDQLQLMLKL